jgi:glycerol-3-phosphate acyltransferase PlsY
MFKVSLLSVISYLIGSIPSGYIIARIWRGIDIRKCGSGNIGFTNILRVIGPVPGLVTLFLDIFKGLFVACLVQRFIGESSEVMIILPAISVVIGHNYSLFLSFQGGRGVATGLGVILGFSLPVAGIGFLVWLTVVIIFRYVSLGSIVTVASLPLLVFLLKKPPFLFYLSILLAVFIIIKHIPNIKRLIAGRENRIKFKR